VKEQNEKNEFPCHRVLMLLNPAYLYINTIRDYCEAFDLFSRHHITFASANKESVRNHLGVGHGSMDYAGFDVLMIHYSVRLAFWEATVDSQVIKAIRKFQGYKILFIQDEYNHTEVARERIDFLGFHQVYTCVPDEFISRVYPEGRFPGVNFSSCLTGYFPPSMKSNPEVVPLSERPNHVVYRGRSLPFFYGELGQEKVAIGKVVREACEQRSIPHDIEWTEEKRVYGNQWSCFLHSGRATLGSESGCNVFDIDGDIEKKINWALKDNPSLSFQEARDRFFEEDNLDVKMNQISPKFFEFIASKTALILYEGNYSDVLKPEIHFFPLKKDHSNLQEILDALEDLPRLEEMVERTYGDVVGTGLYSYQAFVQLVDKNLDEANFQFKSNGRRLPQFPVSLFPPQKERDLVNAAEVDDSEMLTSVTSPVYALLKSKKGNFHGMIVRRQQKIEKLSAKVNVA